MTELFDIAETDASCLPMMVESLHAAGVATGCPQEGDEVVEDGWTDT